MIGNHLIINGHWISQSWHDSGLSLAMVAASDPPPIKRILVVDDDPSIRYMLGRVLLSEGYDALVAADGGEGLKAAVDRQADLVLLDLKMPGLSGQQTLRELAAARPGLPVIIMTAYPSQQFEGGLAGAGALLQKPLDFPMLLEAIKKLLALADAAK